MLKSKLGPYHAALTNPKASVKKRLLTAVERQHLTDIEKTDSTKQFILHKMDNL